MNDKRVRLRPRVTGIIMGDAIQVGGRELVPLVRVTSRVRRRAFVGSQGVSGGGWGFVYMRPVAIVDRSAAGEHRLSIRTGIGHPFVWLSITFFVVPMVAVLLIVLSRRSVNRAF
jgi:hypothetical protein